MFNIFIGICSEKLFHLKKNLFLKAPHFGIISSISNICITYPTVILGGQELVSSQQ